MNRFNQILISVLAVQVLIAGGIFVASQPPSNDEMQTALLIADKSDIDRIIITGSDRKQIQLSRLDGQWQLPDYYRLPASQTKIIDILDSLESTRSGWPVATTQAGRERFEVTDENFQKKIVLGKGEATLQTIYLGTSPGFRQLHVRTADKDDVYAVKLNSFDFPVESADWLDRTLLQPKMDIVGLHGPDFSFSKQNNNWQLQEGEGTIVEDELNQLASTLTRLTVQKVDDKSFQNADYELDVTTAGSTYRYQFFKGDDKYYIKRNDYSQLFKIAQPDFENITKQTAAQLVKKSSTDEPDSAVKSNSKSAG